jgi:nitrate/nitrite-specific signal transduction histidine kinase
MKEQPFQGAEEFLSTFKKGAEFTRELMAQNERLRGELVAIRDRQESAAQSPEQWTKLRHELLARIQMLEQECTSVRERLGEVEQENTHFARRYVEIEKENNNLANLYVASYQLHSTLDFDEVLRIITEIVINLVGAEVFAIYLLDEATGKLSVVASEGRPVDAFPDVGLGTGVLGQSVEDDEAYFSSADASEELSEPLVCVPLSVHGRPLGAIGVFSLLKQKSGFTPLDHELFDMLGGHAATAVFAARLFSQSARELNTIQGFIELLAK